MSEPTGIQRFLSRIPFLNRPHSANGNGTEPKALTIIHNGTENYPVPFDDPIYSRYDLVGGSGTGMIGSSVVAAPMNFLLRTFPEAPPMIQRRRDNQWEEEDNHRLGELLRKPNEFYSGRVLWQATVLEYVFGNAYWIKRRNKVGDVVELWWVSSRNIKPKWPDDGSKFISHYELNVNGRVMRVELRDVVHFRFGIDPDNPRLGLSQLGSLVREVGIDDEAASFTSAVLKNLGIIGLVISPDVGAGGIVPKGLLEEITAFANQMFTGRNRGGARAFSAPTKVQVLQYQMQGFDISPLRDVVEERVCAALALPAAVVGFGTGMQQTKVGATMRELRQLAWTGCIIPMQEAMADEVNRSLLPEFEAEKRFAAQMAFDTTKVRALWEDNNEKHTRVREDFKAKIIDLAEARRETGRAVRKEDEGVYFSGTVAPAAEEPKKPDAPAAADDTDDEDESDEKSVHITNHMPAINMPDINVAPSPVSITIVAPPAGTKVQSGTMVKDKETGEYRFQTTETIEEKA